MKCLYLLALLLISCGTLNPLVYTAEAVTEKVLEDALHSKMEGIHKRLDTLEALIRTQQTNITLLVRSQRLNGLEFAKWKKESHEKHEKVEKYLAKMNGKLWGKR